MSLPDFMAQTPRPPMTPTEAALLALLDRVHDLEEHVKAQAEVVRRQQIRLDHLEQTVTDRRKGRAA